MSRIDQRASQLDCVLASSEAPNTKLEVQNHTKAGARYRPARCVRESCIRSSMPCLTGSASREVARHGVALVSNDDRKAWPKILRLFPLAAIEDQLQQPLI